VGVSTRSRTYKPGRLSGAFTDARAFGDIIVVFGPGVPA
jgi:hypothetical protein